MTTRIRKPKSTLRTIARITLAAVFVLGALGVYALWSEEQFEKEYAVFMPAQQSFAVAAFKPGAEANPIRQQVDMLLAQVLQVDMSTSERLEKARQGIAHLNDIEAQIDEIKTQGDAVESHRNNLDKRAHSFGIFRHRSEMRELVSIAKKQAEVIADIRGLSYRADYYTNEVFERIIDDGGEVTDAHKQYLNDLIPQLEEQFNKRSNLYKELEKNTETMTLLAKDMGLQ